MFRQDETHCRIIYPDGSVNLFELQHGAPVCQFTSADLAPVATSNQDTILALDLDHTSWCAITISGVPRIVTKGWADLRHIVGPYFIGRYAEADGPEYLVNIDTDVVVEKH